MKHPVLALRRGYNINCRRVRKSALRDGPHTSLTLSLVLQRLTACSTGLKCGTALWATCRQLPCPVVPIDGHNALSHRSHTHIPHHSRDLHLERCISPNGCLGAYIGSNHLHPGNAANALRGVGRPHATRHWQQPCTPPEQRFVARAPKFWHRGSSAGRCKVLLLP